MLYISSIAALLRLLKTIIFNDVVQPVCILSIENDYDGEVAVVSGWGWMLEGIISYRLSTYLSLMFVKDQSVGDPANILQKGSVNVWTNDDCQQSFREKGSDIVVTDKQICAGYVNGGIDSCWVSIPAIFC